MASPTLISFLLRQSGTEQIPFARLLNTSQARISRVTHGMAELSDDEWHQGASALALGRRERARVPVWVVTRFRSSGDIDPPPLAADGTLGVFRDYRYARAVVAYLRDIGRIRNAYAVPVWPSFVADELKQRGRGSSERRFTRTCDETGTTLSDWLPKLVRGFAAELRPRGPAIYT